MTSQDKELKDRVEAKRKRIEARIHELKADSAEASRKKIESLQQELNEVTDAIRDGYENLSDKAMAKVNEWLKD